MQLKPLLNNPRINQNVKPRRVLVALSIKLLAFSTTAKSTYSWSNPFLPPRKKEKKKSSTLMGEDIRSVTKETGGECSKLVPGNEPRLSTNFTGSDITALNLTQTFLK
jgi:hypothetical protein